MNEPSTDDGKLRRAHPLAIALIARLRTVPHARVLEIGSGSGRNTGALQAAGFQVDAIADGGITPAGDRTYDGALSTHAFLHGTPATIAAALDAVARCLKEGAPLHATFGSTHDARYGKGKRISEHVYAAESGDEANVPHVYFTQAELESLLTPSFAIESLQETNADNIIGRWAHAQPPRGVVHWFVRAQCKTRSGQEFT